MNSRLRTAAALLGAALLAVPAWAADAAPAGAGPGSAAAAAGTHADTRWADLIPKGWNPTQHFRGGAEAAAVEDGSSKAMDLMREMREVWDNAPTNEKMDGALVRLPGYIVPLEQADGEITEFLLVPYFGACIHSPPPPANQIVHVKVAKPLKGLRSMDAVWVTGRLNAARQDSAMGTSGYQIQTAGVARYAEPRR